MPDFEKVWTRGLRKECSVAGLPDKENDCSVYLSEIPEKRDIPDQCGSRSMRVCLSPDRGGSLSCCEREYVHQKG